MFTFWNTRSTSAAIAWRYINLQKQQKRLPQIQIALQSTAVNVKPHNESSKSYLNTLESEWQQALPNEALPGLTKYQIVRGFMMGGEFAGLSVNDLLRKCRERFGDVYRLPGVFGQPDSIVIYNLSDFEKVYRTEGIWPIRPGGEVVMFYRLKRKDGFFNETLGLNAHGEDWSKFRHAVNPVLMKPNNAKLYMEPMQQVNLEFIQRIREIRDPQTLEVPGSFFKDINRLAFESVAVVALDHEFGLIRKNPDSLEARILFDNLNIFLKSFFDLGMKPTLHKYIKTPTYRRFEKAMNSIFDVTNKYVNDAIARFEQNPSKVDEERSVLEKLLKIDRKIAIIMAMDMLMAGTDTTSSVLAGLFLCIAKNPKKQQKLREELLNVLPRKSDLFTIDNMKHLPYLRACIKESLRMYPIAFGNMRETAADLALGGYQVPKGARVLLAANMMLQEERFFPRPLEFLPERWLRHQDADKLLADNLNKFIYLPFGFGPRSCVGKRIVDLELELSLGNVVRHFQIEYNHPSENPFETHFISTPQIPLNFKFIDLNY